MSLRLCGFQRASRTCWECIALYQLCNQWWQGSLCCAYGWYAAPEIHQPLCALRSQAQLILELNDWPVMRPDTGAPVMHLEQVHDADRCSSGADILWGAGHGCVPYPDTARQPGLWPLTGQRVSGLSIIREPKECLILQRWRCLMRCIHMC